MEARDRIRIQHMIDAGEEIERFIQGRSREDLDDDRMLLFAVVRAIEIFGEGAARLSEETRASAPRVPWSAIIGMRNRLAHAYWDVDKEIVWATATKELPDLLRILRDMLSSDPG
jgi:uncharacterized protein with HEPN domain